MMNLLLIIVAAAFSVARLGGVTHLAFQAFAHLYVGGLIGYAVAPTARRRLCTWLAVVLVAVELTALTIMLWERHHA